MTCQHTFNDILIKHNDQKGTINFMEYFINLLIAVIPAGIAYFAAIKQSKIKVELAKNQNQTEIDKVIKQLEEERYKTDKEIEKLQLEKDNDIARLVAGTEQEIRILTAKYENEKDGKLNDKMFDMLGGPFIESFTKNIDMDQLIKDGMNQQQAKSK